ncbi:hypothetical protein EOA85_12920 [Mesorhizobium sp. M5C.F.Ca.IN.020.29.1.1]|uniref:hypothetical protein n=1 Tax=unclassified Mesorhizobium TaxID=325217 RepID=UPI000FC9E431|nr:MULTISPECIES: hypothetical protein [unclassified Mesorhizobium]RUV58816.1 hypothetical protein EOA85_12920 [Mesorhizobium sp. M5C.F.Ca.IN.020.29.1.1]TIM87494.1 MAG: hypothetical protein E5Y50_11860 [Mesorhizobium sp.]
MGAFVQSIRAFACLDFLKFGDQLAGASAERMKKGPRLWWRAGAIGLGPTCSGEAQGGAPSAHRQSLEIANFLLAERFAGTKIMLFKRGGYRHA